MGIDNNRTWVEKGSYSVPTNKDKPLISLKTKGLLFLLAYIILSEICINYYISGHFLRTPRSFTMSPLWGWRSLISMYYAYGIREMELLKISAGIVFSFFVTAILFRVIFFDRKETDEEQLAILHGSSHWATKEEIIESGLMLPDGKQPERIGVTVGGWKDENGKIHYLRHSGPEHILVVAPTRSGKGISIVVPTLLSWDSSIFVLDIKGENWILSAGWREKELKSRCLRFEPTDENSPARYNPLMEIDLGSVYETRDIQNIAQLICDPDGKHGDDHWISNATTLVTGAITHECYVARNEEREASMINVRNTIAGGDIQESMNTWKETKHVNGECHPTVNAIANEMLQKADKEVSSIFSTAVTKLSLWLDPIVAKNTTNRTFEIKDLVDLEQTVSLYVVVPPSDLTRLRPILRLMVSQIIFGLTKKMVADDEKGGVKSEHKHQLLLMLDEASRLARLDVLSEGLSYIGSYGLKVCLIYQSYKQPKDLYGQHETLTGGCKLHIAFAPNEDEDARILSEKCGKTTVTVGSSSVSGKRFAIGPFGKSSESISYSQQARDLLMPDEVKRLRGPKKDGEGRVTEPGDLLLIAAGIPPIYGIQTPFFFDPIINKRSKIPPKSDTKANAEAYAETAETNAEPEAPETEHAQNLETAEETTSSEHEQPAPAQIPAAETESAANEPGSDEEPTKEAEAAAEEEAEEQEEELYKDAFAINDEDEDLRTEPEAYEPDDKDEGMGTIDVADLDDETKESLDVADDADNSEADAAEEKVDDMAPTQQELDNILDALEPMEAPGAGAA